MSRSALACSHRWPCATCFAAVGEALEELRQGHETALCALNLCASYVNRESDGVCHDDEAYLQAAQRLLEVGAIPA